VLAGGACTLTQCTSDQGYTSPTNDQSATGGSLDGRAPMTTHRAARTLPYLIARYFSVPSDIVPRKDRTILLALFFRDTTQQIARLRFLSGSR
jgi:hypothetical protein